MDTQFTAPQAAHALEVVLRLMKERRFFLYRPDPKSTEEESDFVLDPEVFGAAIELDGQIRDAYANARLAAVGAIARAEKALGVTPPKLGDNKQIVQCNRYTGGLDICRVFPLTAFLPYAPKSLEVFNKQCLKQLLGDASEDDVTPKELRDLKGRAVYIGQMITSQLETLEFADPQNQRCVVITKTRFDCGGSDENHDFMQGRTSDLQAFPHALGYLFYRYSRERRIVRHNHVVFSTSRESHMNVQHWSGEKKPSICYDKSAGYDCSVVFVTVL